MKKVYLILICIAVIMISLPSLYARTVFTDNFTDETKISYKSNIKITNNTSIISNISTVTSGILISTIITRTSNEK